MTIALDAPSVTDLAPVIPLRPAPGPEAVRLASVFLACGLGASWVRAQPAEWTDWQDAAYLLERWGQP